MKKRGEDQFEDYRGMHQPSREGPFIHNLNEIFPDDVYTHAHYYGFGEKKVDLEAARALLRARGRPEAEVDIYRAVPHGVTSINQGDWVTTSPSYARQHGLHADDPHQDWPVLHARVPAAHVSTGGNDIIEWGYVGPTIENARVHFRGGR